MADAAFLKKELQEGFLAEATDMLQNAETYFLELGKQSNHFEILGNLVQITHNFKGSGKLVGFHELSQFAHEVEDLLIAIQNCELPVNPPMIELLLFCVDKLRDDLSKLKQNPHCHLDHEIASNLIRSTIKNKKQINATMNEPKEDITPDDVVKSRAVAQDESVRISLKKIDSLLNNFGEQVILLSVLDHARYDLKKNVDLVMKTVTQLSKLTYDLQQTTIALRMVSLKQLFSKMERTVWDTARTLNKKVNFLSEGQSNELDTSLVSSLSDPLIHMIRNSVDHGIENEEERVKLGKSKEGNIKLNAFRRGGFFYIQLSDDGSGIDSEKIRKRAVQVGLIKAEQQLSAEEVHSLLFEEGFSMKEVTTGISGRGVGMCVVKKSVCAMKGQILIDTTVGLGSTFTIKLPLTLAIFNGIVMKSDRSNYVVPSSDIQEIMTVERMKLRRINERERCVQIRDSIMPVFKLNELLSRCFVVKNDQRPRDQVTLVIVKVGRGFAAVEIDEIISQQKIVHKTLDETGSQIQGATGATILGDGSVALIIDLPYLIGLQRKAGRNV